MPNRRTRTLARTRPAPRPAAQGGAGGQARQGANRGPGRCCPWGGPRSARRDAGQSLVGLAVLLPILLILVFSSVDFGFMLNDEVALANAARDGARVGAVAGLSAQQAQSDAVTEATAAATGLLACTSQVPTATYSDVAPAQISVTVTCQYHAVTPLGPLLVTFFGLAPQTSPTLTQTVTWRLET